MSNGRRGGRAQGTKGPSPGERTPFLPALPNATSSGQRGGWTKAQREGPCQAGGEEEGRRARRDLVLESAHPFSWTAATRSATTNHPTNRSRGPR
jgi:hypothetical protein